MKGEFEPIRAVRSADCCRVQAHAANHHDPPSRHNVSVESRCCSRRPPGLLQFTIEMSVAAQLNLGTPESGPSATSGVGILSNSVSDGTSCLDYFKLSRKLFDVSGALRMRQSGGNGVRAGCR
jgi:hypothetical protein